MNLQWLLLSLLSNWIFGTCYTTPIQDAGYVTYVYENSHLIEILRLDKFGKILYKHSYTYNDADLFAENLGTVSFPPKSVIDNSYYHEVCEYNQYGQVITHTHNSQEPFFEYNSQEHRTCKNVNGKKECCFYFLGHEPTITNKDGEIQVLRIPGFSFAFSSPKCDKLRFLLVNLILLDKA